VRRQRLKALKLYDRVLRNTAASVKNFITTAGIEYGGPVHFMLESGLLCF